MHTVLHNLLPGFRVPGFRVTPHCIRRPARKASTADGPVLVRGAALVWRPLHQQSFTILSFSSSETPACSTANNAVGGFERVRGHRNQSPQAAAAAAAASALLRPCCGWPAPLTGVGASPARGQPPPFLRCPPRWPTDGPQLATPPPPGSGCFCSGRGFCGGPAYLGPALILSGSRTVPFSGRTPCRSRPLSRLAAWPNRGGVGPPRPALGKIAGRRFHFFPETKRAPLLGWPRLRQTGPATCPGGRWRLPRF